MQLFSLVCGLRVAVGFNAHLLRLQHCIVSEQTRCMHLADANVLSADVAPTQGAHIWFSPGIALPAPISYACIPVIVKG